MRHLVSCVLILCLAVTQTFAQVPNSAKSEWSAVTLLEKGRKLDVRLKNGLKVQGVLTDISETALALVSGTDPMNIARADIQKVYLVRGSVGRTVALGAGVGAGAGALVGVATSRESSWFRGVTILFTTALGAIGGVVTGWMLGRSRQSTTLIYEAP
jgi:hypothetical protein